MAVRLRLTRVGGRKDPIWRVVVADQRSPRDGRFIETVGQYNPQTEPSTIRLNEERIRKMGPLTSLLGMIPGLAGHQLSKMQVDERELDRVEAIILSMTPYERRHPELIKGSRRLRIAKGSGTTVQQVNQLVKQFGEMRKMMKGLSSGRMPDLGQLMRQR